MTELWKPIPSMPGYSVSSEGRVRSEHRVIQRTNGPRTIYERILKGALDSVGYRNISVASLGLPRRIHPIVAEAFLGPCPSGFEVNHKDRDRTNNRAENLEYVTHGENMQHAAPKLTQGKARLIRAMAASGLYGQRELGQIFRVSSGHVCRIVQGKSWRLAG